MDKSIVNLLKYVDKLKLEEREIFERIYRVEKVIGKFADDAQTDEALLNFFGKLEGYKEQTIIKTFNKVTYEGSLFNSVRAERPVKMVLKPTDFKKALDSAKRDFDYVPEDEFGTVKGEHSFTSANIAKYDAMHSLVIFNDDNPLDFNEAEITDYLDTAIQWFHKAHAAKPEAIYPFFIWNCLWKSGGSIVHGHAQILLGSEKHYPKVEYLRHVSHEYEKQYVSNYFGDLFRVHQSLGLAYEHDIYKLLVNLTPIKEKELILFSSRIDEGFTEFLYNILYSLIHDMGVSSFNLSMALPPFLHVDEDWGHFPAVVRIVDRGNPLSKISDIGAMELYAASVVSSDPFKVSSVLNHSLGSRYANR